MPGDVPKIKFSPFEALLIGEKNKVIKRQPLRNTIFVTRLNKVRKKFNLRELFDLKNDSPKKLQKPIKLKINNGKNKKTEKKKNVYCYEFEGRKLIVKGNEFVEFKLKDEKNKKKECVKFRPDFKFKETLEEKIVNKFQNRRRNHKEVEDKSTRRLLVRGPDGKFLSPKESQLKSFSIYLERLCEKKVKKLTDNLKNHGEEDDCTVVKEIIRSPPRVAKKFCDYSPSKYREVCTPPSPPPPPPPVIKLPPYPKDVAPSDYDDNECLIDIIYEHHKSKKRPEINRPKDLKVYGKKKSTDIEVLYDSRVEEDGNESIEKCIKKEFSNFRKKRLSDFENRKRNFQNSMRLRRRNGFNSRIDEPLNIDDHLIEGNNLGTLFFNTSNGDNVFLGNIVRPFLFDSPFGSLPSV